MVNEGNEDNMNDLLDPENLLYITSPDFKLKHMTKLLSRHVREGGGGGVADGCLPEHLSLFPLMPKVPFCEGLHNLTISKIN